VNGGATGIAGNSWSATIRSTNRRSEASAQLELSQALGTLKAQLHR